MTEKKAKAIAAKNKTVQELRSRLTKGTAAGGKPAKPEKGPQI